MKKELEHYKAIYFDAGETLVSIHDPGSIMQKYLAASSFDVEQQIVGQAIDDAIQLYYVERKRDEHAVCSAESDRLYWVRIYRAVLEQLNAQEFWEQSIIEARCHELYDLFISPQYYNIFEDVQPTMEALSGQGYHLGIISNFAPTLREILRVNELLHYFDPVIISTEVGLEKPNPHIFKLALEKSAVPLEAKDVLYIGDHVVNDIWAPAQIGMDAVRIKRYAHQTGEGIESLYELYR